VVYGCHTVLHPFVSVECRQRRSGTPTDPKVTIVHDLRHAHASWLLAAASGRTQSAGSFTTRRDALRAANREEQKVLAGAWHDTSLGEITFRDYVDYEWLPNNKQGEASTRAGHISYLNEHVEPHWVSRSSGLAGRGQWLISCLLRLDWPATSRRFPRPLAPSCAQLRCQLFSMSSSSDAWASGWPSTARPASSRATGTRNGEQET
jgi:hypothetical protein